jgi:phosphatidylethanolamine/phosphatidyl-N-methylethanolamine N-methyltransferase
MALFEPHSPPESVAPDAATRALSVTAVENDFVTGVYQKIASVYDPIFGPTLYAGRVQAIQRMGIQPGDRVLEVGVGTAINAALYPCGCAVTGIDLSESMLEKARDRIARKGISHVRLIQMDAADLRFADGTFDIVYASHLINCVSDPIAVAREMSRVCRRGGRVIFLNHFRSSNAVVASVQRVLSRFTVHLGFKSDFDMPAFLAQADLVPASIEKVNIPRVVSLVICVKE